MKPANTPLTQIDLGAPALQWPDFDRVTISMQSPDDRGAVAYYFDTLAKSDKAGDHWGAVGRAACAYLLGLVRARSLQLVRGPYLTVADDTGAVPDGWTMIRAVVWVEEFDLVVEPEPTYFVTVNGRCSEVTPREGGFLTYVDVVILAELDPGKYPTVTMRSGRGIPGMIMGPGSRAPIRQRGTVFDVAYTNGA